MTFSLRLSAVLALAPALIAFAAQPSPTGTIVASNMNAASVSVVDVATGANLATIPTGQGPHEVAVSHDGRWAVVSIYGNRESVGSSLLVIDLQAPTVTRAIELGAGNERPHGIAFLPGDRTLLVTGEKAQRVLTVDFATGRIDSSMTTGQPATHMIAASRDGKRAFTTNITGMTVSAIDVPSRNVRSTFTIGTRIEGIAVSPDGREVWVGGNESHNVMVLNGETGAVERTLPGFGMPYRLGITPDGKTAVISDPGAERIHLYDVATKKPKTVIEVPPVNGGPASPQGVTISRDGSTAFVTLKAVGQVAVVDIASATIVKTLTVGAGSDGVAYSPRTFTK